MYKVYLSNTYNPYFNLAFEEYLVHYHNPMDQVLFLWQNRNTIVIGRNQNPWKECNLDLLNQLEGQVVRRLSGGGAVYHDVGNLNFTFISAYSDHKVAENIGLIIKALSLNGINASFSGKNDILVQEHKISGNAFFIENEILCHHGTLLLDVDLSKMSNLLTVSEQKLQSKGIDSVRSRVKNLKELNSEISIESLKSDLVKTFSPVPGSLDHYMITESAAEDEAVDLISVHNLKKRFERWDWNFGSTPEFNIQISERFEWGSVDLYLIVKDGIITNAEINTDALDIAIPQIVKDRILNTKFNQDNLKSVLQASHSA